VHRQIDDKERTIWTPGEGDLLAEVALFPHGPNSTTAVAVEHGILLAIRAPRMEQIVRTIRRPALGTLAGARRPRCLALIFKPWSRSSSRA
jgi:CRP-like cAMP-binding protein